MLSEDAMRVLVLAVLPLTLAACQSNWEKEGRAAEASGGGASRSYDAANFTGVELRGADDVVVRVGPAFSVKAEGDAKVLDQLDIRVVDNVLRVGRKDSHGWNWHGSGAKVLVTMPSLTAASVAGSGNLDVDRAGGDFAGAIAGSGNLKVAQLSGGSVDLSIAGSGDMTIGGTATKLNANTVGSGDIDAQGLTADAASVSIAGSGSVRGTVKGEAQVSIMGSGDAVLTGGARCKVSKMGSGDAQCS
jgi:hypothetical protein